MGKHAYDTFSKGGQEMKNRNIEHAKLLFIQSCHQGFSGGCVVMAALEMEEKTGRKDKALKYREKSFKMGGKTFDHLAQDSDMTYVRTLPKYQEFLTKYKKEKHP